MNKRLIPVLVILAAVLTVSGCGDRLDMEDAIFPLGIGIDLDQNKNLVLYDIHPMFYKDVKEKSQKIGTKTPTLRMARDKVDSYSPGVFQARKVQVVLVSKQLLQYEDWFRMTDVYFRDTKNPLTPRIIAYDGPLSEIVFLNKKDTPMLPLLLRGMVDTKSARSETVSTTMQELHWQMYEKGITPSVSEIKLGNRQDVTLSGTALLTHRGKYSTSLSSEETVLLNILQKNARKPVSLSLSIPGEPTNGPFDTNRLSFTAERIKTNIKTSFRQNKFRFDIRIRIPIVISELLFPFDIRENGEELEKIISTELQKHFEKLIKKIQEHKIDPAGFGRYARAYNYSRFKQVQENWGGELARADIRVTVDVTVTAAGPVK